MERSDIGVLFPYSAHSQLICLSFAAKSVSCVYVFYPVLPHLRREAASRSHRKSWGHGSQGQPICNLSATALWNILGAVPRAAGRGEAILPSKGDFAWQSRYRRG